MGIRIAYNFDTWDASTPTASSEYSSDLAVANILSDHIGKVWRSADTVLTANIVFNLGSAVNITVFSLFNFNFTSGATLTLEGNASDSWGAPSYSQTLTIPTDADGNVIKRIVFFLNETYQYWRLVIDDSASTESYLELGRALGGTYYEPSRTMSEGYRIQIFDPSEGTNKGGTHTYWRQRNRYRRATTSFAMVNRTQYEKFSAIFEKIGNSKPALLCLDPANYPSKESLYCYLVTPLTLTNQLLEQYDVVNLVWEEKTQ